MTTHDAIQFPLSVSFHTIDRDQTPETAELLVGSSVQAVELWEPTFRKNDDHVHRMQSLFETAGIEVRSVHANFGGLIDISSSDLTIRSAGIQSFSVALDLTLQMGARIIIVHPSSEPIPDEERPGRMERAKCSIRTIVEKAGNAGCQIALELLPRT
jgi:sugar phosphate isomerase/epimerase